MFKKSSYNSYNYLLLGVLAGVLQDKKKYFIKNEFILKKKNYEKLGQFWKITKPFKN